MLFHYFFTLYSSIVYTVNYFDLFPVLQNMQPIKITYQCLAARETCAVERNFAARKKKMFLPGVKNIFASRTQILCPKHMFPSLATTGNITRNIVSATMFHSLARP